MTRANITIAGFDKVGCIETAPALLKDFSPKNLAIIVSINVFVAGPSGNYQCSEKYVIQRGGIGYNNRMAYI